MAITIRELLASDTVSQAADKINFNFDQLLLNGGGPQGPQGPQGPPGPIGGRGIRGSVWYEDTSTTSPGNNPNTVPPTLTPEDEDNYLQFNGIVWTYDASIPAWVPTNIDLTGPTGPPGASGKFAEYGTFPYNAAGDTTIFPDEMSFSADSVNRGVRSVLIGGLPASPAFTPTFTGTNIVPSSIASQLQMPNISMMVHQFSASGRGIVFHGGDPTENFEQVAATELSNIGISNDDLMVISVPKAPTLSSVSADLDGFRVLTPERNQLFQAGKRIWLQAGASPTPYGAGDLASVWIETDRNNASIPDPTIELRVDDTAGPGYDAELQLGGSGTAPTTSSKQGDFWVEAGSIGILSNSSTTVNSGQGIDIDAVNNIDVTSSSGDISLNAPSGQLFSTSQTVDVNATTSIDINAGSTINMIGAGLVRVRSTGDDAELSSTAADVNIQADQNITVNAVNGNVNVSTSAFTGGDVLIDTSRKGSQIKLETTGINAPINITTSGAFPQPSDINISTTGTGSQINLSSIFGIYADAPLIDLTADSLIDLNTIGAANIILDTTAGSGDIRLYSANQITIRADTEVGIASITTDVNLTANSGNVNLTAGDTVEVNADQLGSFPATAAAATLKFNGSNTVSHSSPLTITGEDDVILSGMYTSGSNVFVWQKIGATVSVNGILSVGSSSTVFSPPVQNGNPITRVYGVAVLTNASSSENNNNYYVGVRNGGASATEIEIFLADGGTQATINGTYYVSYSYILEF